jgi:hypothetical protein
LFVFWFFAAVSAFFVCGADAAPIGGGKTNLSGVKEGWAWPVIVIQPPEGWESPAGESVKYALLAAEREISLSRGAVKGYEVTFMFSSVTMPSELAERLGTWRNMKSLAILSFGGQEMDIELKRLCATQGPAVIFAGGENLAIKDPGNGLPFPYLFALDYTYFARSNALAEFARQRADGKSVAVLTDRLSEKLARGAQRNADLLRKNGVDAFIYYLPAMTQNRFNAQIEEAVSSGAGVITSWLDAISVLSVWRTLYLGSSEVTVCFSGEKHNILLDANGLVLVDKDDVLNNSEDGKRVVVTKTLDFFGVSPRDPVLAAKAYALGKWAVKGFINSDGTGALSVASALSRADGIPLMDETLSVDPGTHRPKSRKFGVSEVRGRTYKLIASVDVYSSEVVE